MSRTYTKEIDGELKKIDTDKLEWIWGDGRYGSRPTHLHKHPKKDDMFFLESISKWQGEKSAIKVMDREEAIDFLKEQTQHPSRQEKALNKMGIELEEL